MSKAFIGTSSQPSISLTAPWRTAAERAMDARGVDHVYGALEAFGWIDH